MSLIMLALRLAERFFLVPIAVFLLRFLVLQMMIDLSHQPLMVSLVEGTLILLVVSVLEERLLILKYLKPLVLVNNHVLDLSLWVLGHPFKEVHMLVAPLCLLYGNCYFRVVLLLTEL